jgi:uncharacterized membrane protein
MLTIILRFVFSLALALWIGGMTFFTFIAAPSIFTVLPREAAGNVVADIFPKYYWLGMACGVIALIVSFGLGVRTNWNRLLIIRTLLLGVMLIATLYAAFILQPQVQAVKAQVSSFESLAPTDPLRLEFGRLHGRSFAVNAAVLLLGVIVVFLMAFTMKV